MKVLVVTGGTSNEKEISLMSGKNIQEALKRLGYETEVFDWSLGKDALEKIASKFDLIFPVIHGKEGEDGDLQEFLEKIGCKFVGSSSTACKNGWNKIRFKLFCDKQSIKTPKWQQINSLKEISLDYPFIIKPSDSGSSIDVYLVKTLHDLKLVGSQSLFEKYSQILAEKYINGIEVTVGVLRNKVLPPVEIIPPPGKMFDYENKYNGKTQEIVDAPSLNSKQKSKLKEVTRKIHFGLNCRHYSRTDFIVDGNNIYALEINTIPGLTSESLFPKEAKAIGLSFDAMAGELVNEALKS